MEAFYRLGLLGYPLEHSLSPVLHRSALVWAGLQGEYRLYAVPPREAPNRIPELLEELRQGRIQGLNVTIPYKEFVLPWVDHLTGEARTCGAVNTLYREGRNLVGHNTDVDGFWRDACKRLPLGKYPRWRVVVLGAGGAARAVVYAALRQGWPVHILARRLDQARGLVEDFQRQGFQPLTAHPWTARTHASSPWFRDDLPVLLVNATPVGMHPRRHASPWPEDGPWPRGAVYDLIYNPQETLLVQWARRAGLPAVGGLGMLVVQAALAFERWTGFPAAQVEEAMWGAIRDALAA